MATKKNNTWPWLLLGFLVVGSMGFLGLLVIGALTATGSDSKVALIEVSGAITDEGARGFLGTGGTGGARDFISNVEKATEDTAVKAVVIRVNSPGGSAAASQEMYQAVRRLRKEKPVVCSMGDVAASGGYYVAAACNKIYANGSTLTGSIGVISQFLNYAELFRKLGLDQATIKSGAFKDAGNPMRSLTPAERQLFQAMISDVYAQFVADVLDGRKEATASKLTAARLAQVADGRVLTGRQARKALLVDENGGLHDAVLAAAKLGGIEGKPVVKKIGGGGGLAALLGAEARGDGNGLAEAMGAALVRGGLKQLSTQAQQNIQLK